MKAGHEQIRFEVQFGQLAFGRTAQRLDIGCFRKIWGQCADGWLCSQASQSGIAGVQSSGSRRRTILRVKRSQQDSVASGRDHRIQPFGDGRRSIAHGPIHPNLRPGDLLECSSSLTSINGERRTVVHPHFLVSLSGLGRASEKDRAAQYRLPQKLGDFHHPPVGQKLTQITPDGRRVRCVGRAQIYNKDADIFHIQCHVRAKIGSWRNRCPVTVKRAFAMAGAIAGAPISLSPAGRAVLRISSTVTSPISCN